MEDDLNDTHVVLVTDDHDKDQAQQLINKKEQKRRPKPKDGKILLCGVCGDRALGYNFDAISCESCKAFFRRNALKLKPFVCTFDGKCTIDAHSRKFCSGCRIQKCYAIGMKKEWILDANQLQKRRQRQQTRRLTQPPNISSSCDGRGSDSSGVCDVGSNGVYGGDCQVEYSACSSTHSDVYDKGAEVASDNNACHSSTDFLDQIDSQSTSPYYQYNNNNVYQWNHHPSPIIASTSYNISESHSPTSTTSNTQFETSPMSKSPSQLLPAKVEPYHEDEWMHEKSMPPFESNTSIMTDLIPQNKLKRENSNDICEDEDLQIKPLNPYIRENLEDMCRKYNDVFEKAYTKEETYKYTKTPKTIDQLYNMTDLFIRRLIRFTKFIPEFKSLSQDDQICLLKGGIMELFVLRSSVSFDAKAAAFKYRTKVTTEEGETLFEDGGVKSAIMNSMNPIDSSMFKNHMTVVHTLQELTDRDLTILVLIFIIQLMSPDRPNVKDNKTIAEAQDRHLTWLQAYLRSKNDGPTSRLLYLKLMEQLKGVKSLGKANCQMLINVEIDRLEPILLEIFDLS